MPVRRAKRVDGVMVGVFEWRIFSQVFKKEKIAPAMNLHYVATPTNGYHIVASRDPQIRMHFRFHQLIWALFNVPGPDLDDPVEPPDGASLCKPLSSGTFIRNALS
jgi:hypothetical protein